LLATAAVAVGGRLVVAAGGRVTRLEEPAVRIAESLGVRLALGEELTGRDRHSLASRMAGLVLAMIDRRAPDDLLGRLLVTGPWPAHVLDEPIDAMTFSGGVAEYLYGRETARFGDLGHDLAHELQHALAHRRGGAAVWDPGQGIRATVIGAAQFSVQISGNTITIADPGKLPLHNLPVMACTFALGERVLPEPVASGIREALERADCEDGAGPVALAFPWRGEPLHARLHAVAQGVCAALPKTIALGLPLVLLIDGDVGMSLGRIIHHEIAPGAHVISIDGLQLQQFDYVDIGRVIDVTNVVPIIIKSLLFK
jgi:ethanolamine utilization protein EutA